MGVLVAGRPTNLNLPPELEAVPVDSDMYDICGRLAEVSPRLHVNMIRDPRVGRYVYVVMEHCVDGVDRKLFRTEELDARAVRRAQEAIHTPLQVRLERALKEQEEHERKELDNELERMYEMFGMEMRHRFQKDGFTDAPGPVSYPKAGVATRGRKRGSK